MPMLTTYFKLLLCAILLLVMLSACEPDKNYKDEADQELADYLENLTSQGVAYTDTNGIYYVHGKTGLGLKAQENDSIVLVYAGYKLSNLNEPFVESGNSPDTFLLATGEVIEGWISGITLMRENDQANIIVPYDQAYGESQTGTIPPYSNLLFSIHLVEVIRSNP